jgi:hypothetical protein
MNRLYSYQDYERAYYHGDWYSCITIGCYLLSRIHNDRTKKLYKQLNKASYAWDAPQKELEEFAKLLSDVKIWIMVNE